jgi:hypothetical protein
LTTAIEHALQVEKGFFERSSNKACKEKPLFPQSHADIIRNIIIGKFSGKFSGKWGII